MSDLSHADSRDVETSPANKFADLRFPSLLNESTKHEWKLVFPVLCGWLVIFVILLWQYQRSFYFAYRSELLLTHCSIGVAMAIVWTAFYGSVSWTRIATTATILFVTGIPWVLYESQYTMGARNQRFLWALPWIPVSAMFVGMIPATLARRFWGWRIFHVRDNLELTPNTQFTLRDALVWMAYVALLCTLLRIMLNPFFTSRGLSRTIVGLSFGFGIPLFALMCFLRIVGHLKGVALLITVPVLAAGISALTCIPALVDHRIGEVVWDAFAPVLFVYVTVPYGLMSVMAYLRRQGVVFAFGNHDVERLREESTRAYSQRLHKRIDRLQTELDSLHR